MTKHSLETLLKIPKHERTLLQRADTKRKKKKEVKLSIP